ncbi:MAG: nucleotidyltransferase family protein [Proteobacteria bacterium]|nr:nucleotidyltransferase family protein [Pseudomonadota bacterium]MCL2307976.1 nucleotidyltransferase family protein [Pseudomonadota bacterium]
MGFRKMKARAMILAAGRGERMRPLSDHTPKPLLIAGGKPLIVWQIEALARAGFHEIVINVAWKSEQIEAALGDGAAWHVRLLYSREHPALETAGGIARALPLLEPGPVLVVSADVWSAYDHRTLLPRIAAMREHTTQAHLVMVPNPPYHPEGDFALDEHGLLRMDGERLTFGNIGIYHTRLFAEMDPDVPQKLTPYYRQWVAQGIVSGERYDGAWFNIGAPEDLAALETVLG